MVAAVTGRPAECRPSGPHTSNSHHMFVNVGGELFGGFCLQYQSMFVAVVCWVWQADFPMCSSDGGDVDMNGSWR